ncbi:MAG: ABC transporter ATP-binding protein [Pseudomonadota bacterium]
MTAPSVSLRGSVILGGAELFGDLALDLPAARWTCLLGPSGVGKSTVLRLIAGLTVEGTFDGVIEAGDGQPLPDRIAYMAQSDLLLPWLDVTGNVCLGARLRGKAPDHDRARDLIDRVGLSVHASKRPAQLSGGMRQRVALARTLMEDRPVALLDEPFSALDARTRAEMQELAFELLSSRTVLLVTHDPAEAVRMGSRIVLMSRTGATEVAVPPAPPIRANDDPSVLAAQAQLLTRMREAA